MPDGTGYLALGLLIGFVFTTAVYGIFWWWEGR